MCIGVVGERPYAEYEGDSADLAIVNRDLAVLDNLNIYCERIVVVLVSGRPLLISDRIGDWDALVAAWLPGTEGQGIADVLFGVEPFVGKHGTLTAHKLSIRPPSIRCRSGPSSRVARNLCSRPDSVSSHEGYHRGHRT